jgi:hypothetical protein
MKEQALGLFARRRCFKLRAGLVKGFANHRFCDAGQNRSGCDFLWNGMARQNFPTPAEFAARTRQITPL